MSTTRGLRVLFLNYEYPPLGGGAGMAMAELATRLAERGASVEIVTTGGAGSELREVGEGRLAIHRLRTRRKGVHHAGMGTAAGYLAAALPRVRQLLRDRRPDVVHVYFSLPTGAILPLLNLRGMPVVVSLRGSDVPGYDLADQTLQRTHRLLRSLTRWIWRRADRVVALSEGLGRLARRTERNLDYVVIRNGVDTTLFRPPADPRSSCEDRVHCIAVARLIERKGIATLLHALYYLPRNRFRLEIVGSGRDAGELRRLALQLGLAREVYFAGAVDHDSLAEYYQRADLFTLVPENEAFGNVFAEALASGLPIVGSRVGGIPEFVEDGANGLLIPSGDPQALVHAMCRLVDNPRWRAEIGLRNRIKAENTLSWGHVTDQYLQVYHEAIERRAAVDRVPAFLPGS